MAMLQRTPEGDIAKMRELLLYIFKRAEDKPNVGATVLNKLVYFMDFDHYEIYEEPLLCWQYIKNHHGPTAVGLDTLLAEMTVQGDIDLVKQYYFIYPQRSYRAMRDPDMSEFTEEQIHHIDEVFERLSCMTAGAISDYSHSDYPWMAASRGEILDYEAVFYRDEKYSRVEYDEI